MNYRYERKLFVEKTNRKEVELYIKTHPAFFREIYHERHINNIYFDFIDFKNFQDNIIGNVDRLKYRIRWYGKMFSNILEPKLELKIKKGIVGTKDVYDINSFELQKGINSSEIKKAIKDSTINELVKENILSQYPILLNRYKRTYFQSLDKKFRITIDDSQHFYRIGQFNNQFISEINDTENVIIELKYDRKDDFSAAQIIKNLPFRITKSSKYSRGVEIFYV